MLTKWITEYAIPGRAPKPKKIRKGNVTVEDYTNTGKDDNTEEDDEDTITISELIARLVRNVCVLCSIIVVFFLMAGLMTAITRVYRLVF